MYLQMRGIFLYMSVNKGMRKKRSEYMKHHYIKKKIDSTGTDKEERQQSTLRCHNREAKHRQILQHIDATDANYT
jgi:hypothetical protein